jgi:hypothetical protein
MTRSRFSLLVTGILTSVVLATPISAAAAQEVVLTPLEATEMAKGYRAEALKLATVVNEKKEQLGRIDDFIFGKDGNIYVVLAVDDAGGLRGHRIAIPFRSLKLDDPSRDPVLPGATRESLAKLPVYISSR